MLALLRVIIGFIYLSLTFILGFLLCLLRPFNPNNSRLCGRMFSGVIKIIGAQICIISPERFDTQRPCVFISNHQHNFDLCVFGGIVPKETVTVGKKSLFWIPFFGQLYVLAGNILIDRSNRRKALESLNKAIRAISNGTSIWIMPEGTRSKGRGLLPFKKGPFHMALGAEAMITPICLSDYRYLNLNKWSSGTIYIELLPPISTYQRNVEEIKDECYQKMKEKLAQLNQYAGE